LWQLAWHQAKKNCQGCLGGCLSWVVIIVWLISNLQKFQEIASGSNTQHAGKTEEAAIPALVPPFFELVPLDESKAYQHTPNNEKQQQKKFFSFHGGFLFFFLLFF